MYIESDDLIEENIHVNVNVNVNTELELIVMPLPHAKRTFFPL